MMLELSEQDEPQQACEWMQIGEVARKADMTVRAVRYYEELDLIHPATRTEGGFRLYHPGVLRRLQLIQLLREFGYTLKDVQVLLAARRKSDRGTLRQALKRQWDETNKRIAQNIARRNAIARAMSLAEESDLYSFTEESPLDRDALFPDGSGESFPERPDDVVLARAMAYHAML